MSATQAFGLMLVVILYGSAIFCVLLRILEELRTQTRRFTSTTRGS
jgi:hypothetical protein